MIYSKEEKTLETTIKYCSKCHKQKTINWFYKFREGTRPECKSCTSKAAKGRYLKKTEFKHKNQ